MKVKHVLITAISFIIMMPLTACLDAFKLEDFRSETIAEVKSNAEVYLQEKYNKRYHINNCMVIGSFNERGYFLTFEESGKIFGVVYDKNKSLYYDDKQADEIVKAIKEEIWQPMTNSFSLYCTDADDEPFFSAYSTTDPYFHQYYDGDIEKFTQNEMLYVELDDLIIVDDDTESWLKYYRDMGEFISKYFRSQEKGEVMISIVTSDYYNYKISHNKSPGGIYSYDEGCVAKMRFSSDDYIVVNKYIRVKDDIYVMLVDNDGYTLVDGDIELIPEENDELFKEEIYQGDKDANGLFKKFIKPKSREYESPIYRMEFSERLKRIIGNNDKVSLAFMLKEDGSLPSYVRENREKEESYLFRYDRLSSNSHAIALCQRNGEAECFSIDVDSELYLWVGTGPTNIPRPL